MCFFVNFCEVFKNNFYTDFHRSTASAVLGLLVPVYIFINATEDFFDQILCSWSEIEGPSQNDSFLSQIFPECTPSSSPSKILIWLGPALHATMVAFPYFLYNGLLLSGLLFVKIFRGWRVLGGLETPSLAKKASTF